METTKYTFWSLIKKYSIEIPIIQRDYAQGRMLGKVPEIRKNFLNSLFKAINSESEPLDIDFVYGSLKDETFIPLDGQQRLTTLFLLHWYLGLKDNHEASKELLKKFTYETRTSSSEFCNALVENGIILPSIDKEEDRENVIKSIIEDSPWFFLFWKRDPTIKSMLIMLDAIHDKFKNSEKFFEKLTSKENPPITFQFIKIDNFNLTDDLYIKMNARGKALTDFENFKARFEQFLDKKHNKEKEYFSSKIDGTWTDFFWKFKEDDVIDKPFIRYFYFITEMLYFLKSNKKETISPFEYIYKNPRLDFELIEMVYTDKANLDFLFKSLNRIGIIEQHFENIFSNSGYEQGKVALFSKYTNLVRRCIKSNDFGIFEKILLFSIIKYYLKLDIDKPNENLRDFIRVIRNLLLRVRWQDNTEYKSNLRYEFLSRQITSFFNILLSHENIYKILISEIDFSEITNNTRITEDSLQHEVDKAKIIESHPDSKLLIHRLEDHHLLKGAINNLNIEQNVNKLYSFINAFQEVWDKNSDSLIIRTMLTIDDFAIYIGWSSLGDRYYFGNDNRWNIILTKDSDSENIKEILPRFLESCIECSADLKLVVNNWLNSNPQKDWRYYFIKYSEMTSTGNNLYVRGKDCDFEIRNLTKTRLNGWHINPYVRTVAQRINNERICNVDKCFSNTTYESPVKYENNVKLFCEEKGWRVVLPEGYHLTQELISLFNLESIPESLDYLLKENDNKDRIEVAVEFSEKIDSCLISK